MKTTAEIMDILNERKKLYEEKQNKRKKTLKIISAVAAALILFTSIPVGAFIISRQAKQPAEIPTPEQTAVVAETPETPSTSVPDTDRVSFPTVDLSEIPDDDHKDVGKPTDGRFEPYISFKFLKEEKEIVCVPRIHQSGHFPYYIGARSSEIESFEIVFIGDYTDWHDISIEIEPSEHIDLVSDSHAELKPDKDNVNPTMLVEFKYKTEDALGSFKFTVRQKAPSDSGATIEVVNIYEYFVAKIKDYDYTVCTFRGNLNNYNKRDVYSKKEETIQLNNLFEDVAVYFGDVDQKTDKPIFYSDPYNESYRGCPLCVDLRKHAEAYVTERNMYEQDLSDTSYIYFGGTVGYDPSSKYDAESVPLDGIALVLVGYVNGYEQDYYYSDVIAVAKTNENGEFFMPIQYDKCSKYKDVIVILACDFDYSSYRPYVSYSDKKTLFGKRGYIDVASFNGGSVIDLGYYNVSTGALSDVTLKTYSENGIIEKTYGAVQTETGDVLYNYYYNKFASV